MTFRLSALCVLLALAACKGEPTETDSDPDTDPDTTCDTQVFYADADQDGAGDPDAMVEACEAPTDGTYVLVAGDCDDADPDVQMLTFFADSDGDGFGDPDDTVDACEPPTDYVDDNADCDDADPDEKPGTQWYQDADRDGYGNVDGAANACERIEPTDVSNNDDCNDDDSSIRPGGEDTWYDGIDGNCDGANDFDQDGDGYAHNGFDGIDGLDCDDEDAEVNPDGVEVMDGSDNDCDGMCDNLPDAAGRVMVTEYNVSSGQTWIELKNVGDKPIGVCGWSYGIDPSGSGGYQATFAGRGMETRIEPGELFVVDDSSRPPTVGRYIGVAEPGSFYLAFPRRTVDFQLRAGEIIVDQHPETLFGQYRGYLQVSADSLSIAGNDDPSHWCRPSALDGSTRNVANRVCE